MTKDERSESKRNGEMKHKNQVNSRESESQRNYFRVWNRDKPLITIILVISGHETERKESGDGVVTWSRGTHFEANRFRRGEVVQGHKVTGIKVCFREKEHLLIVIWRGDEEEMIVESGLTWRVPPTRDYVTHRHEIREAMWTWKDEAKKGPTFHLGPPCTYMCNGKLWKWPEEKWRHVAAAEAVWHFKRPCVKESGHTSGSSLHLSHNQISGGARDAQQKNDRRKHRKSSN